MLENYAGKDNIRPSIDQLANEVKEANKKPDFIKEIAADQEV